MATSMKMPVFCYGLPCGMADTEVLEVLLQPRQKKKYPEDSHHHFQY
jgi:hypothetical protein